ncbi:hypothetical protein PgNI_05239 [Pyricularia grisea]|uniref:Formylmethionine deformylase-like protein n=1 Tax=Pyricularia grisea TaxID=148305 RepID=A0A6P8B5B4_PYRGI|nr:hypothetical protein PgNI_05239 [Pyricularia grisea]TLD10450.1 hypothetical protein PgNI_05239 [Pyricularia grisea]
MAGSPKPDDTDNSWANAASKRENVGVCTNASAQLQQQSAAASLPTDQGHQQQRQQLQSPSFHQQQGQQQLNIVSPYVSRSNTVTSNVSSIATQDKALDAAGAYSTRANRHLPAWKEEEAGVAVALTASINNNSNTNATPSTGFPQSSSPPAMEQPQSSFFYGQSGSQPQYQVVQDANGQFYYSQSSDYQQPGSDQLYQSPAFMAPGPYSHTSTEYRGAGEMHDPPQSAFLIDNNDPDKAAGYRNGDSKQGIYHHTIHAESPSMLPPGQLPPRPSRSKFKHRIFGRWRWHSWWGMFLFGIFGIACAIGHHAWYSSLHGKKAERQLEYVRYGTILAFGAKAGLSASIVMAYRMRVWTTVRTRLMSVRALDSMFAATEDVTAFFNWEFISRAKTVAALVAFVWLSPLIVILTANTLIVEMQPAEHKTFCPSVRTLNFGLEETNDWRKPTLVDDFRSMSLSFYNSTITAADDPPPEGWFDYWTGASPKLEQAATIPAFMETVSPRQNVSSDVCSQGWDCLYNISFTGPGYKCTELASGIDSVPKILTMQSGFKAKSPIETDWLLPKGSHAYYAFNTGGEYSKTQMKEVSPGGKPIGNFSKGSSSPKYPSHMGAFRTDPLIWIGYSETMKPYDQLPVNRSDPEWNNAFVPKIFACEHYETKYTVQFNHTGGVQNTTVLSREFMRPIINTTYLAKVDAEDGTNDNTTAVPESNYIKPQDIAKYRLTAGYYGMGQQLRLFLNGTVSMDGPESTPLSNPNANTKAMQTKLLEKRLYTPYKDLMGRVQGLYEDMLLSIFADPLLDIVVWAAKPNEPSGLRTSQAAALENNQDPKDYEHPCVKSKTDNVFVYKKADLWAVYTIGIGLTMLGIAAGLWAVIWEERQGGRIARNTRFSSIVAATRGPALDGVAWWAVDRGRVPKDVMAARMGFGLLPSEYRKRQSGVPMMGTPGMPSRQFSSDTFSLAERRTISGYSPARAASPTASLRRRGRDPLMYGFGLEGEVEQPTTKLPKFG